MAGKEAEKDELAVIPKAEAQKHVRSRVGKDQINKIIDALMLSALGCYLFQARAHDGKWIDVEDVERMREIRDNPTNVEGTHFRFVSLEKPDVRAATLLLAYAVDRPAEQHNIDLNVHNDADLVARLREAYKREPERPAPKAIHASITPGGLSEPPSSVH